MSVIDVVWIVSIIKFVAIRLLYVGISYIATHYVKHTHTCVYMCVWGLVSDKFQGKGHRDIMGSSPLDSLLLS